MSSLTYKEAIARVKPIAHEVMEAVQKEPGSKDKELLLLNGCLSAIMGYEENVREDQKPLAQVIMAEFYMALFRMMQSI